MEVHIPSLRICLRYTVIIWCRLVKELVLEAVFWEPAHKDVQFPYIKRYRK